MIKPTSMLPGRGSRELSRSPSGIQADPLRWKIQRRRLRAAVGVAAAIIVPAIIVFNLLEEFV